MDKEYFCELRDGVTIFVQFETDRGNVKEFAVKLLCEVDSEWYEVIRHDSGHGCPHKDILDTSGKAARKVWYGFLDNNQALTMAIADTKGLFIINEK